MRPQGLRPWDYFRGAAVLDHTDYATGERRPALELVFGCKPRGKPVAETLTLTLSVAEATDVRDRLNLLLAGGGSG